LVQPGLRYLLRSAGVKNLLAAFFARFSAPFPGKEKAGFL